MQTEGANINIAWSPDGKTVVVGNREDLVTYIDVAEMKIKHEYKSKFEVRQCSQVIGCAAI